MRRADRLFRIVQLLRQGRVVTADRLAEKLQVCPRTIYRDVRDLQLSGTPIEGEPGVGYTLRRDFDLPPLMFTSKELTALVLGARLVQAWGGAESVATAKDALQRIEAVLPPELRDRLDAIQMYAPGFQMSPEHRKRLDQLHAACVERQPVAIAYNRLDGEASRRIIRPLGLYFWSGVWTLVAWCELRNGFRTFRLDHIAESTLQDGHFTQRRGQALKDYLRIVKASAPFPVSSSPLPVSSS
jgi:predicted DNA-binding transcriptional regulator YafY